MKSFEDFLQEHPKKINDTLQESSNIEEFDKIKTKVLKYVLYKKRTKQEVIQKFSSMYPEEILEEVIENLVQNGYLNDEEYIQRAVNEFLAIHTLSMHEIFYKLYAKGISKNLIENYFSNHQEELQTYEINSAKKLINKKCDQISQEELLNFLYKKGYKKGNIQTAIEELEEN